MTLQDCYAAMGGDYADAIRRLMKEERVCKYLGRFMEDTTWEGVEGAFASGDYPLAFRLTHTVKGVAGNLGFTALFLACSELCETVRDGAPETDVKPLLEKFLAENERTRGAIADFLAMS